MQLFIKNMVCNRCIAAVKQLLQEQDLEYSSVQLGEVDLIETPSKEQLETFRQSLRETGFELLDDQKQKLIAQIKTLIIEQVHYGLGEERINLSHQLSSRLHKDYSYLSHLFSEVEGITIEKYLIHQKIERVKELLAYDEANLSEIAFQLGYSSVSHLSAQFKKVTGLTPSHFKKMGGMRRNSLDNV
jgi:AraC-like DNA-binding protein